jgi:predicted RNase H-like nuclease
MREIAGVDGVPGGWVVVRLPALSWAVVGSAAEVVSLTEGCAAVGVDIPLAVPESGRRPCDGLAAARLGRARSSIFPAPPLRVLQCASHASAVTLCRELTGKGISIQTWNIRRQILDWLSVSPLPARFVEVSPELSFRGLSTMDYVAKKTARGAGQRIAALLSWVGADAFADLPPGARLDDCLDALACTWSAARWAAGTAEVLGGEAGAEGRLMRVVV